MWSVGCGVLDVECWMWNVGCEMMDVECGIWNGASGTGMFSHRPQLDTETMRVAFIKKHRFHRCARMGLFTDRLLLLRCLLLGF